MAIRGSHNNQFTIYIMATAQFRYLIGRSFVLRPGRSAAEEKCHLTDALSVALSPSHYAESYVEAREPF